MRFNSVIGAIAFVLLSSFVALLVFVQTKSFGNLVSRVITDVSQKKADTKVSISNIQISVFPPGIELIKVTAEKKFTEGQTFQAEMGKIGFYFSLLEIEERKLTFGEIRLSDAVIDFNFPEKKDSDIKKIDQTLIDEIFNYSRRLPVRVDTVLVENTMIHANHDVLTVRRLKLFKQDDVFITRFHLANIKPVAENPLMIDEIWADAEIGRKDIVLHRLKVQHDVHSLIVKGKVTNYPLLKEADLNVNGEGLLYLKALKSVELPGPFKIESGTAQANFHLSMIKGKIEGASNILIKDLRSNIAYADLVTAKFVLDNNNIILSELDLSYEEQKVKVVEAVRVAQLGKKDILGEPVKAEVSNLELSNALRILGPSFKPLRGSLTGKIAFHHSKGDLFFIPENGFKVHNLALVVGGDEKPFQILKITQAKFTETEFALVNSEFQMSAIIELANSLFEIDGYVNKKGSKFSVIDGKIDLSDLGDVAKLGIAGKGRLSVDVLGPLDDIDMNFIGKMADFEVLEYKLGQSDIDLNISLKDSTVTIKKLESVYGKTAISGNGAINYKTLDIALGINSPAATFHDLEFILKPIFSKLTFMPKDFELNANIDAYIHGKTKLNQLKIKSNIKFTDLHAYGENINRGSFKVGMNNEKITIDDFEGNKEKGSIEGNFYFLMPNKHMGMKFKWGNLSMSSFNLTKKLGLNFDGYFHGGVEGDGKVSDYVLTLKNEITDTRSQNYKYPDSTVALKIMPDRVTGEARLLGPIIQTEFDYSLPGDKKSFVKVDIDIPDVKPLAVAFIGQHLENEEFSGKFKFNLDTSFMGGFNHLNLKANLKELTFVHETFKVNYISQKPEFLVTDSHLINWDLNIKEPDLYVMTKGHGTFGKEVSITNDFHFNSKILELLLAQVLSSEGFIRNVITVKGNGSNYQIAANSKSEQLSLSIEGAPFPLNELKYDIDYANDRLVIRDLSTSLESGSASIRGDIYFSGGIPDVNIKYQLDRAEIPVMGKSSFNATGEGIILGNELPYNLGGEIVINKGQIVNELNDFSSKSVAQVRYLPKNQESFLGKLFNLNLNIKAENPVRITNSLMDVALKGEVRLFGSPVRPRAEGRLFVPINTSRIFFKNNEYFITNADINFSPKKEIYNPDFDVQAITFISSYKINAKAYGDLERFNFDLTSDPALPRNSILSLIAFGYTDEIQSTLTQGEQQNLTQVGVGSFVFDRFKISDILNKQFGLQVNLGTVFEQSQTQSMLSGRSQDGQGTLGRTRSATRIELKKRLDEALTLSVSSTMGGSIGQRQSMNLTYSINKKVQAEGVYELRTNAEGEEDIISNSIGGDLKFRWTFK